MYSSLWTHVLVASILCLHGVRAQQEVELRDFLFQSPVLPSTSRNLQTSAEDICNQLKDDTLADPNQAGFQLSCECEEVTNELDGSSGTWHLTCEAGCGHFCNPDETVCLIPGSIRGIDANGIGYLVAQTYRYTRQRNEVVRRQVTFNAMGAATSCEYVIDGISCLKCSLSPCPGGVGSPIQLECGNIEVNANFDFCVDPTPSVSSGVFQFLRVEDFVTCFIIPPSASPTTSPTFAPFSVAPAEAPDGGNDDNPNSQSFRTSGVLLCFLVTISVYFSL